MSTDWIDKVCWGENGLIPAIAQDATSGVVLMVAWMNREALLETVDSSRAVYWSRSRSQLWRKGEESGHVQRVKEVFIDCDGDVVLLKVDQAGGIACHTGRANCFFRKLEAGDWIVTQPVLVEPNQIYAKS
ncbi:MAG: phosphoribosyl-AMP cyclohydrolase [Burkholderiales bacterium]|nr:phosphoribosyl-AMP cyclohydrolase [Burkholderiales bacterium]